MTIFHLIKFMDHDHYATEYPNWVVREYNKWATLNYDTNREERIRYMNKLLEQYDPEVHGEELYPSEYIT